MGTRQGSHQPQSSCNSSQPSIEANRNEQCSLTREQESSHDTAESDSIGICYICHKTATVKLLPCGHDVMCHHCSWRIKNCPHCQVSKIYLYCCFHCCILELFMVYRIQFLVWRIFLMPGAQLYYCVLFSLL